MGNESFQLSAPLMEEALATGGWLWKTCRWPERISFVIGFPCHIQRTLDWESPRSGTGREKGAILWPEGKVHA